MLKSDVIRTPDERFENRGGFPLAPQYAEVLNPEGAAAPLPMHDVDEVAMKVVDWMAQTSA